MYRLKIIPVLFLLTLVVGCATTSGSPQLIPPKGTQIEVTRELSVEGGARLHMQYGKVKTRRNTTVGEPYCLFVSNRPSSEFSEPLVIRPEIFTVKQSYRRFDYTWQRVWKSPRWTATGICRLSWNCRPIPSPVSTASPVRDGAAAGSTAT